MLLGEFGTNSCSKFQQIGRVDRVLTKYVGVEYGCEITTTTSMDVHQHIGILRNHPSFMQYSQLGKITRMLIHGNFLKNDSFELKNVLKNRNQSKA